MPPPHGDPRRRPREPPTHQQYQQQRPNPTKRRDTADSNLSSGHAAKRPRVRFTPPLDAPLLSQVATMSGYLRKQADNEPGKWNKYYFVLKPTTYLYYYTSQHDAEPRGIIDTEFLRDVRFNADCVQRSVGGSAHGFRITGQLPAKLCPHGKDPNKTQFRPVYFDCETREQAEAWMEAIRHHRFDLARHRDYDDLLDSMDEVEEQLTKLRNQTKDLADESRDVLRKGKELVCKLRGVEMNDEIGRPRGMSHEDDIAATIESIGLLFDELYAEADRQRRVAELLRQREDESVHNNSQLKELEAELKIQVTRCERLQAELEAVREDQHLQKQGYDMRYEELVARERQLLAREKEMLAQIKERERLCDQRMQEVDQKSSKWAKELEKEAAKKNAELEKRRKALEKQQKTLDQKQKQLDKRLQETAPSRMRFVGAIGKSRASPSMKQDPIEEPEEEEHPEEYDHEDVMPVATRTARTKSRFGFLNRKGGNHGQNEAEEESSANDYDMPDDMPEKQSEIESDYFDSQAELSYRRRAATRAVAGTQSSPDRNSDASTTRLSGVSYSSSISTQHASRTGRSHTTGAILPPKPPPAPGPKRSASVPATNNSVYAGMTVRLPPEWTYKESKKFQGRLYYYNRITGETRWEFPYDAVLDNEAENAPGFQVPRESARSSFDDGNDFETNNRQSEREDIAAFLTRTRANTMRANETHGAWSTRDKLPSINQAEPQSNWESRYYSDQAMASRMGYVPEEPEDEENDEEEPATTGKKRRWGRKLPKMRSKSTAQAPNRETALDEATGTTTKQGKGWKLMPKFGKGAKAKASATTPESPRDTDPIVHDNGRCEF